MLTYAYLLTDFLFIFRISRFIQNIKLYNVFREGLMYYYSVAIFIDNINAEKCWKTKY